MSSDNPIDPNLLKRMMMGEFSSSFADKKESSKSDSFKRKIEFDLHFEKLYPKKSSLSSGDKLKLQIEELNLFILEAKKKSIRSVYLIVGKGKGVLRKEVMKVLTQKKIKFSEIADPPYFGNAIKINF